MVNYRINAHWRVQLNINNLLNTDSIEASVNRFTAMPGAPLDALGRITYSF